MNRELMDPVPCNPIKRGGQWEILLYSKEKQPAKLRAVSHTTSAAVESGESSTVNTTTANNSNFATAIAFNKSGSFLAIGYKGGSVGIWDSSSFRVLICKLNPVLHYDDILNLEDKQNLSQISEVNSICWSCNNRKLFVAYKQHPSIMSSLPTLTSNSKKDSITTNGGSKSNASSVAFPKGILAVWDVEKKTIDKTFCFDHYITWISAHPLIPDQLLVCCYNSDPIGLNVKTRDERVLVKDISNGVNIVESSNHDSASAMNIDTEVSATKVVNDTTMSSNEQIDSESDMQKVSTSNGPESISRRSSIKSTPISSLNYTVCAKYNATGSRIYCVSTLPTLKVLDGVSYRVLLNYPVPNGTVFTGSHFVVDMEQKLEKKLLIPTSKGIRMYLVTHNSTNAGLNKTQPSSETTVMDKKTALVSKQNYSSSCIQLTEAKLFTVGMVRQTWSDCAFSPCYTHVLGLPTARSSHLGEQGLYLWSCPENESKDVSNSENSSINGGVTVEANHCLREGIHRVVWQPNQACLFALTMNGSVLVLEEAYQSNWAGPMYPPNFTLINDNMYYDEPEDEFDVKIEETDQTDTECDQPNREIDVFGYDNPTGLQSGIGELRYLPAVPIPTEVEETYDQDATEFEIAYGSSRGRQYYGSIFRPLVNYGNSSQSNSSEQQLAKDLPSKNNSSSK